MVAIPILVLNCYIEYLFQILAKKGGDVVQLLHFNDCSLSQLVTQSTVLAHAIFSATQHTWHLSHRRHMHVLLLNKQLC